MSTEIEPRRDLLPAIEADRRVTDWGRSGAEPYRYEREVEDFLRYSPNVRGNVEKAENTRKALPGRRQGG